MVNPTFHFICWVTPAANLTYSCCAFKPPRLSATQRLPEISGSLSSSDLSAAWGACRVYAADAHAVAVIPTACVFPHAPYTLQMGRLPEIYFSGSLLIRQGVGWVGKPNIPHFICWVTPAANPTYSCCVYLFVRLMFFQVAFLLYGCMVLFGAASPKSLRRVGCVPVARTPLPISPSRVRAFRTHPTNLATERLPENCFSPAGINRGRVV